MKPYQKNFLTYHNLIIGEFIPCAICKSRSVEIHHISGKPMGNKSNRYDTIENLIPLCRDCHDKCHNELISKQQCKEALYVWAKNNKSFIDYDLIYNFNK